MLVLVELLSSAREWKWNLFRPVSFTVTAMGIYWLTLRRLNDLLVRLIHILLKLRIN